MRRKSKLIASKTPFSPSCLTYFSQLEDVYDIKPDDSILVKFSLDFKYLKSLNITSLYVNVHKTRTPPHLLTDLVKVKRRRVYRVELKTYRQILQPFPYQTDCYVYEKVSNDKNFGKSQEDCIVKYLQLKELEVCGCNRRWFYSYDKNFNLTDCGQNSCHINFDRKELERKCKKASFNNYYLKTTENIKADGRNLSAINFLKD